MKKAKIITITIALLFLITLLGVCYLSGYTVLQYTLGSTDPEQIETGTAAFLYSVGFNRRRFERSHIITQIEIPLEEDGYVLADLIEGGGRGIVIMAHGAGVNGAAVYPVAQVFLDMGYDVLAYDKGRGGGSTGSTGYLESRDLIECIRWAETAERGEVILWGVSWGAAAVGIALGDSYVQETVKAAVLDSPVSDLRTMVEAALEANTSAIPNDFLMTMGNVVTRLHLGFWYEDADARRHGAQTSVPVLLLTSRADKVAPFYMGDEIYNAIPHASKRISTVVDSAHGEIYFDGPVEYAAMVAEFLATHF